MHVQDKKALLHLCRTNTNVYIGIGSTCIFKGNYNRTTFIKVRFAQSVEHRATHLKVVGSISTVGKYYSFFILLLLTRSLQVECIGLRQMKSSMKSLPGKKYTERMIIWRY